MLDVELVKMNPIEIVENVNIHSFFGKLLAYNVEIVLNKLDTSVIMMLTSVTNVILNV
jgi:hypothetical protein